MCLRVYIYIFQDIIAIERDIHKADVLSIVFLVAREIHKDVYVCVCACFRVCLRVCIFACVWVCVCVALMVYLNYFHPHVSSICDNGEITIHSSSILYVMDYRVRTVVNK